ncbi:hypothetical protein MMA231_02570 [Asticcacaulis sp. MM231]
MPLRKVSILTLAGMASLGAGAQAQTMSTTSASYQAGYGLSLHQMQTAIDPSTRDSNGNRVIVDGVMSIGSDNSVYSYSKTLAPATLIQAQARWAAPRPSATISRSLFRVTTTP